MIFLIAGGTGTLGQKFIELKNSGNHKFHILSRQQRQSDDPNIIFHKWDGKTIPNEVPEVDVVMNLAGAWVAAKPWSDDYKKELLSSLLASTKACVDFINQQPRKPEVFLSSSTVGIYGAGNPEVVTEDSEPNYDFLGNLSQNWEEEAKEAETRTILLRISRILDAEDGILPKMVMLVQARLGGKLGKGDQGFPWVHVDDTAGIIDFCIQNKTLEGPVNVTAPHVIDEETFSKTLAGKFDKDIMFDVPEFLLKLALGERSVLLWGGQKVIPKRLMENGYEFKYPKLDDALDDLLPKVEIGNPLERLINLQ